MAALADLPETAVVMSRPVTDATTSGVSASAPNGRQYLRRLLASWIATTQSTEIEMSILSGSAAAATQTDDPTSSDAMISSDSVEADATTPPPSYLQPFAELTASSDDKGTYPLRVIHLPPGFFISGA